MVNNSWIARSWVNCHIVRHSHMTHFRLVTFLVEWTCFRIGSDDLHSRGLRKSSVVPWANMVPHFSVRSRVVFFLLQLTKVWLIKQICNSRQVTRHWLVSHLTLVKLKMIFRELFYGKVDVFLWLDFVLIHKDICSFFRIHLLAWPVLSLFEYGGNLIRWSKTHITNQYL